MSMGVPPPDRSTLDAETGELLALATAPSGETAETIAVLATRLPRSDRSSAG